MLTLQILDAGQTYYRDLEAAPLLIGSGTEADVRLAEAGVAERHARIEPLGDGGAKIVDLGSDAGTRVNGEHVAQWRLEIGDRIEVGRAVLVVGRRVLRAATPDDVLEPVVRPGRRHRRPEAGPTGVRRAVLLIAAVAAVITGIIVFTEAQDVPPARWGVLVQARNQGRVAEARALIAELRRDWAGTDAERHARIDQVAAEVEAIADAVAAGRERVQREAPSKSRAQQIEELQAVRATAGDHDPRAIATVIVLSDLDALREAGLAAARAAAPVQVADGSEDAAPAGAGADSVQERSGEAMPGGEDADRYAGLVATELAAADAARREGRFAEAFERLKLALSLVPEAHAAPLNAGLAELRTEIAAEAARVVAAAEQRAARGGAEDLERALAELRQEARRFPGADGDAPLARAERELEARLEQARRDGVAGAGGEASGSPASAPTPGEMTGLLALAREQERAGRFSAAAETWQRAAERIAGEDPGYARRLSGRAEDAALLARFLEHVEARVAAVGRLSLAIDGGLVELSRSADGAVEASLGGAPVELDWSEVRSEALTELAKTSQEAGVWVGAAVLAYRAGERAVAEDLLAGALAKERALQATVDGVIARGRGETQDSEGYRLVDGRFVSARELRVAEEARKLERTLVAMLRSPRERREQQLEELLAQGPQVLDAVVIAFRRQAEAIAQRIDDHTFHRQYEKVAALRTELDRARDHARELIFDEVRYFYPYKPPAVSSERATEYQRVQREVDERVEALRRLWTAEVPVRKVPARLLEDLERFEWVTEVLTGFAETVTPLSERVEWVRALPENGTLDLRSFCWDRRERAEHAEWQRIDAHNEARFQDLSRAEIAQVQVTNAYRRMFGHRPLAVDARLVEAARGHADEMSRLGYFSHFSPTEGRRTPFERMKLCGYAWGISENIANHPTAESAHVAWIHSSGHHRNLLHPSHTEFGVGNDGKYWVQNFGRGEDYRKAIEIRSPRSRR